MSGTPLESEVQAQWKAVVDMIETIRDTADSSIAGAAGKIDVLLQTLEGEYTPVQLAELAVRLRAGLSGLVTPAVALAALRPILLEYMPIIAAGGGEGSASTATGDMARALYLWLHANTDSIKSRGITYGTPAAGGSNVGNGTLSRLTLDEHGYKLESCTPEVKTFRCVADARTGAKAEAEVFEVQGEPSSYDALLRGNFGSGDASRTLITALHAGQGAGGSLLTNGSFSTYSASSTPKFTGWTQTAGGANIAQDTTNFYRSFPNATTDASLKITGNAGTVTLTQPLTAMRTQRLDPATPYFLRVMVNASLGSATGGDFVLRFGSVDTTVSVGSISSGWQEILVNVTAANWLRNVNEAGLSVEIEWNSSTGGYLLVDDMILAPWSLIDGTYWVLRQKHATPVAWVLDDKITATDTGGAPGTGILQWWWHVAGLGYLPSDATPTIADP